MSSSKLVALVEKRMVSFSYSREEPRYKDCYQQANLNKYREKNSSSNGMT